ncbi:(2,3-dihydroxybenzoyl)adenylate synthase [Gordonia rhizosphera]|uniref:Putative 2,3-dihydroxybenzoate-AMP ligase n=1 Tax=Gordonia rhizosphera NBRC 16068 TaxID=1108045 RepID=K6WW99_9ACTN|nr:AMP-binding protein [Gordonia rhizosphera]GAB90804.1 putative 2,3-dihydroxybenzoate-AMP ligase [Gordonia rhizosphera NBRC 16068]
MSTRTPLAIDGVVRWPDDTAAAYRDAGYWQDRSIQSFIAAQVEIRPDDPAVIDGDVRMTYRELWDASTSCARGLLDHGLAPGDRILLQLPNCWQFGALTIACFRTGVIPVMALPAHRRTELTHLARLAEARALVIAATDRSTDLRVVAQQVAEDATTIESIFVLGELSAGLPDSATPEFALAECIATVPGAKREPFEPAGQDIACLLLSGGTTGLPKLIVRTHDDYAYNIRKCNEVTEIDSDTVYLASVPISHNFALACPGILGTWVAGGRVVLLPSPAPERSLQTIDAERVTVTAAVPAVAQSWIEHQREHHTLKGSSLRVLQVGGSRMPDELAARVQPVLGATLQQVFGMAEGLINMTRLDDPTGTIETTQGRPVSDADEIAIVDELGDPVPDGSPGRLLTRGPYTPRGYFRAAEHNARAFTPDGWYGSGDIVIRRPDGNLVVAGRDKDMINRGGEKISAEEVENFAYQLTGVEMAAAVAMPDPVLGERLCLYLTVADGHTVTLADVADLMQTAGVARFKIPERLVLVDQMPTTKVGKIDKKAMREDIRARLERELSST